MQPFGQIASTDALGNRTAYAYDRFGNLASVTDPLGNTTVYGYDLRGNKTHEGGATYPVRYAYDIYGNTVTMTTFRDESQTNGDVTTWLYDEPSGLVTNKLYADGKGPSYAYTPNGNLTARTWARGVATDYAYDGWGSLTNTVYSDGTPSVSFAYDALGRQAETRDAAGVTTCAYDGCGSLTNETVIGVAGTNTIERYWDAFGRPLGYALNGGRQTTLAYDPATGRLASMLAAGSNTPFVWSYLPGSDLKSQLAYPNGLTASWAYDAGSRLTQVRNAAQGGTVSQYDYTYDAASRRVSCAKSGFAMGEARTDIYGYNARSELVSSARTGGAPSPATEHEYAYDPIGNRTSSSDLGTTRAYTSNNLNQYTGISDGVDTFVPQFDDDGNQTSIKTSTGIWQVQYNGENRPIIWMSGTNTVVMSYDSLGRRIAKNSQYFIYNEHIQVADNRGNVYVWDPTEPVVTRPLKWIHNQKLAYYTHDGNKNVSEVLYQDDLFVGHYDYAPFGAVTSELNVLTELNSFRFSSEYTDTELGLVYYNYRCFDNIQGRWLCRDIINENGGLNLYSFLSSNCISLIDFLGLVYGNPVTGPNGPVGSGWGPYYSNPWEKPNGDYRNTPLWYEELPDCPCSIPLDAGGNPIRQYDGWSFPSHTRHNGGTWEIRSNPKSFLGPAQQCVFDACGNLINVGDAAGTPDKIGIEGFPVLSFIGHIFVDWLPYQIDRLFTTTEEAGRIDHMTHPPNMGKDGNGYPCPDNNGSEAVVFSDCPCDR